MSISANVSRSLYIDTVDKLYQILDSHPELLENNFLFTAFYDFMKDYYEGCACSQEENLKSARQEYNTISNDESCNSILLEFFNCNSVKFTRF